ncbi:uncharacterized protein LOC111046312 isoform X4 [Nilaparvata lugens]|uniref:uncharacterized protein LOC111046312 isoform X4 n=1 Tax=Nilaparvata lugens TaxID=108931 RepID=UPI00193CAA70|nr:uncharacterized protein LOC111046312 isoform X4 [Nilaparvata lugens]
MKPSAHLQRHITGNLYHTPTMKVILPCTDKIFSIRWGFPHRTILLTTLLQQETNISDREGPLIL